LKWVGIVLGSGIICAGAALWYMDLDKSRVIIKVAADLGQVKTVMTRESDTSVIRLLKLYNSEGDYLVDCWFRRPKQLSPQYQAILLYAGVKTKESILDLIPDRPDLIVCAIQYPYERPRGFFEHLIWLWSVRQAGFRVVAGGILATTYLIDRERVEGIRLTLIGASLGSFFAGIHASIDTRVSRTLIVHGGGNFRAMAHAYQRLKDRGWPVGPTAWLAERLFGAFDPVRYVHRIAPRELVILATTHDRYFPPESAQALYDQAREPKKIFWTHTDHVKSRKDEALNSILNSLIAYLFPENPRNPGDGF